jgi:hypothetical protein
VRTSLRTSRMSRRKRGSSADRRVHVAAATAVRACRRLSPGWSSGGDGRMGMVPWSVKVRVPWQKN